jgi:Flp pilus assembly pilin Flp
MVRNSVDQRGASMVEMAILIVCISVVVAGAVLSTGMEAARTHCTSGYILKNSSNLVIEPDVRYNRALNRCEVNLVGFWVPV